MLFLLGFPILLTHSANFADVPPEEILRQWRQAIHAPTENVLNEAQVMKNSDEDGVQYTIEEFFAITGDYHSVETSNYDTSEVLITKERSIRRDPNGFIRNLRGRELIRTKAAAYEDQLTLLGPPASLPPSTQFRSVGDSLELSILAPGGDTVKFVIDPKSWLPVRSSHLGEEEAITTFYERWQEANGILIPFTGRVEEADKPTFTWNRTNVRILPQISGNHFGSTTPEFMDTFLDSVIPPIPFNFENSHIIFSLKLNGKDSVLFLLDTGADEEVINTPYVADFGLKPYGSTMTTGGGGSAAYSFATGATFRMPGVEIRNQHVAILDETGLEKALGMKLGGILGYDFISRFVIEIDYEHKQLFLNDPISWNYTGKGFVVPVTFDQGIPFADATMTVAGRTTIPAYMVLDFGAAETMTLTSPFVKAHDLVALAGTNSTVNKLAGLENQFFSQQNVRGRIDKLSLGNFQVKSFPANFSVNTKGAYASRRFSGTIGEGIYRRYHVFLDYARDRVIFEPTSETDKPYPERRTYGLTIIASGADLRTYTVTAVRPNSPAESDGFKKGDVVSGMDKKTSKEFTLGDLREKLTHENDHVDFKLIRDSKEIILPVGIRLVSLDQK